MKPINYYLDLSIYTSLNHVSIIAHLVIRPKNKLISIDDQKVNFINLLLITILTLNLYGKNFQISSGTMTDN